MILVAHQQGHKVTTSAAAPTAPAGTKTFMLLGAGLGSWLLAVLTGIAK